MDAPPLEAGWAGKPGAMNAGVRLAAKKFRDTGYIWFSDADIRHDSGVWLIMAIQMAPTLRLYDPSPLRGVWLPLIALLYMAMTIHSAVRHTLGRGVTWKERNYDLQP